MSQLDRTTQTRGFRLTAGVVVSAAVLLFFAEIRGKEIHGAFDSVTKERARPAGIASARSYRELREQASRVQDELYLAAPTLLAQRLPALTAPVQQTEADRELALQQRKARRAFDGAPPTIPHQVDQRAQPNCLACHQKGAVIGSKVARVMSHPRYDSCTQCHVASNAPGPAPAATSKNLSDGNVFAALEFGGHGSRASEFAPPTVPHPTWMRQRCNSCHGVAGAIGLRVTHPERQNCRQCHAAQSHLDQRSAIGVSPGAHSPAAFPR